MNDKNSIPQDAASLAILRIFEGRTAESVQNDEEMDYQAQKAMVNTQRISRISLFVSAVLSIAVFYLIGTLVLSMGTITQRMGVMSENVASMKTDFQQVAGLMTQLDSSIVNMNGNISVIPALGRKVLGIDQNLVQLVEAMNGITPNVGEVDRLLTLMDRDMKQMNNLFDHLNYSVGFMARDVDTLSAPMRMLPPFFGN